MPIAWIRPGDAADQDDTPTEFTWEWPCPSAHAVDISGTEVPARLDTGTLEIPLSTTPIFIDSVTSHHSHGGDD